MPERATVFHVNQIGVESVYGTAVAANKLLQAATIAAGVKADVQMFKPSGTKYTTTTVLTKEWTEAKLGGGLSYEEIVYWLASAIEDPGAPTAGAGSEQNWTFLGAQSAPDGPKSYTIEQGGGPRAHKFAGALVTDIGLKFSRQSAELDGSIIGKAITDNIFMSTSELQTISVTGSPTGGTFTVVKGGVTSGVIQWNSTAAQLQTVLEAMSSIGAGNVVCTLGPLPGTAINVQFHGALGAQDVALFTLGTNSLTGGTTPAPAFATTTAGVAPTTLALQPVAATHFTVLAADAYTDGADTGYTTLARLISAEWSLTGRYQPVWVLDGQTTYVAFVEVVPKHSAKLLLQADAEGMAYLTTLRNNATKYLRLRATGPTISSAAYRIQIDLAARVANVGDFADSDGVYAVEFTYEGVYDATIAGGVKVRVRNTLAGL